MNSSNPAILYVLIAICALTLGGCAHVRPAADFSKVPRKSPEKKPPIIDRTAVIVLPAHYKRLFEPDRDLEESMKFAFQGGKVVSGESPQEWLAKYDEGAWLGYSTGTLIGYRGQYSFRSEDWLIAKRAKDKVIIRGLLQIARRPVVALVVTGWWGIPAAVAYLDMRVELRFEKAE